MPLDRAPDDLPVIPVDNLVNLIQLRLCDRLRALQVIERAQHIGMLLADLAMLVLKKNIAAQRLTPTCRDHLACNYINSKMMYP